MFFLLENDIKQGKINYCKRKREKTDGERGQLINEKSNH